MLGLHWQAFEGSLAQRLQDAAPQGGLCLYWLGQAGFVIDWGGLRMLIDPYLSDSLARKYKGTRYGHVRMMAAPIAPEAFTQVDLVLCTHRHTDHMDPDTLQVLAAAFPRLRFVVPAASLDEARKRCGVQDARLIAVDAGDSITPLPGLRVMPVAAAHEQLSQDAQGRHEWLGYVLELGGVRLYHSGDCVPYEGLPAALARLSPDLALLPVNGRDAERSGNGVPGNFTLQEAAQLCREAGVRHMLAHHYGLFDFNTVSPQVIDAFAAGQASQGLEVLGARMGAALLVR